MTSPAYLKFKLRLKPTRSPSSSKKKQEQAQLAKRKNEQNEAIIAKLKNTIKEKETLLNDKEAEYNNTIQATGELNKRV